MGQSERNLHALITTQLTVRRISQNVLIVQDGRTLSMNFAAAKRLSIVLKGDIPIDESVDRITVLAGPNNVVIVCGDKTITFPTIHKRAVRDAIYAKAMECDEAANADKIVEDAALLSRTPVGQVVGLTRDPKMRREAKHRAETMPARLLPPNAVEPSTIVRSPAIVTPGE